MSDFSWSYSAYSSAVRCLRHFKLCYVDKIVVDGPESSDLLFGSALHSAINAVLTGQDGQAVFELYWLSYKDKDVQYGRFDWKQLANLGAEFIRKFVKMHADNYKLEFAEKRLYGEYRGVRIEGTPDYYGSYKGISSLRDFKTSGRNYESAKSDCATQLYLYSYLCIENGVGKPECLGYTVFNKGTGSIQDLTWEFDESKMYEALDNLVAYCGGMELNFGNVFTDKYPKNYNACLDYNRKCDFFAICHGKSDENK
jgi:hypothetical protein